MKRVHGPLIFVFVVALTPAVPAQEPPQPVGPVEFVVPDAAALGIELAFEPASYDRASSDELTTLSGSGRCSKTRLRGIDLTLEWSVERPEVDGHRVDLSKFATGFARGEYLTSGERSAAERGLIFEGAEPGVYYYWRLLTRTGGGWRVSGAGRVEAPICPADEVYE